MKRMEYEDAQLMGREMAEAIQKVVEANVPPDDYDRASCVAVVVSCLSAQLISVCAESVIAMHCEGTDWQEDDDYKDKLLALREDLGPQLANLVQGWLESHINGDSNETQETE